MLPPQPEVAKEILQRPVRVPAAVFPGSVEGDVDPAAVVTPPHDNMNQERIRHELAGLGIVVREDWLTHCLAFLQVRTTLFVAGLGLRETLSRCCTGFGTDAGECGQREGISSARWLQCAYEQFLLADLHRMGAGALAHVDLQADEGMLVGRCACFPCRVKHSRRPVRCGR